MGGSIGEAAGVSQSRRVDEVAAGISRLIRDENLPAGGTLPGEAALAARFDVSRPVVREALRSLSALGILTIANGRRPRVGLVRPDALRLIVDHAVHVEQVSVQQVMDVRRAIETRTVALAALRRTEEEACVIRAEAAAMRQSQDDFARMTQHDIAFHLAIARAARNPMFVLLVQGMEVVTTRTAPVTWRSRRTEAERLQVFQIHDAIAWAIEQGDADAAAAAMADHFDLSVKALIGAGIL